MFKDKKTNEGLIIIIGSLILIECLVIEFSQFVNSVPAVKQAIALATTVKPETFTELYFANHLGLPKEIKLGTLYSFQFVVHNLEYRDFTYIYEVSAEDEEGKNKIILSRNRFLLKHDEIKTVPVTFKIINPFRRMKITVNLINKNQPIHFWVEQEGVQK